MHPQPGVPEPDKSDQLPVRRTGHVAALWVLGAHGGAAESTLADLDPTWTAAGHTWPLRLDHRPSRVLVAARTSTRGLLAARAAAKQWASGLVPAVEVVGLVLVADAPGRVPRPLRELAEVTAGGYPRFWRLPWVEAWRLGEQPKPTDAVTSIGRLCSELTALLRETSPGPTSSERN